MRIRIVRSAVAVAACLLYLCAPRRTQLPTFDVVVSHSQEDASLVQRTLRVTRKIHLTPRRTVLYTKGAAGVRFPGVDSVIAQADDGAAPLAYILENYYNLPDYVLFTPADPQDWHGFALKVRAFHGSDVHNLGHVGSHDLCSCAGCSSPNNVSVIRIAPLYRMAVGRPCTSGPFAFLKGFVVSKRAVYMQNHRFYEYMQSMLYAPPGHWVHGDEHAVTPHSPETTDAVSFGHVLEHSWPFIFGCFAPDQLHLRKSNDGWVCNHVGPPSTVFRARKVPANTVWLLWLTGWETAPWVAQRVAAGWAALNPGWNVELISDATVRFYLPDMPVVDATPQARSDLIRLHLLAEYGGVWADATLACMQPLDAWVEEALRPSGFWAYHGTVWPPPRYVTSKNTLFPASWFLVARPGNALVVAWRNAADAFWRAQLGSAAATVHYFWMDALLRQLLESDASVAAIWNRVHYVSCEDDFSAHWLNKKGRMLAPISVKDAQRLDTRPPYVMKLTHKGGVPRQGPFTERFKRSAIWHVLERDSFRQ
jgi:hypothetical protein